VTLSGGERQRVAIARAIINHPKLILADEPTGNLDVVTAIEIRNLFVRLKTEENMAIILVTHDQSLIEIADEHYHLENGKFIRMDINKAAVTAEKKPESRKKANPKTTAKTPVKKKGTSVKKAAAKTKPGKIKK
jgi:ABC-type lipoprotein export system ATPase subunit